MIKRINSDMYVIKNNSEDHLKSLGFKKTIDAYVYSFPVMYYNNKPTMECEIKVYDDDKIVRVDVYDSSHNTIPAFYYDGYGNFDAIVQAINQRIFQKFKILGIKKARKNYAYDNNLAM